MGIELSLPRPKPAPVVPIRSRIEGTGPVERKPLIPNNVLGMIIFIVAEVMFFAGLVSAYIISSHVAPSGWPPPGQPRLPTWETAINTAGLLASGVLLWKAGRGFGTASGRKHFLFAMTLGTCFVFFQGIEWVLLIAQGLTLTYSTHAAFFYLIIGIHALHAIIALVALGWAFQRLRRGTIAESTFTTVRIFWYFVVGVWPVLYLLVYL